MESNTFSLYVLLTPVMLESSSEEMWTQDFCKALKAGVNQTQSVITAIEKLQKKHGKAKRELVEQPVLDEKIFNSLKLMSTAKIRDVLTNSQHHKVSTVQPVVSDHERRGKDFDITH